jgi:hypothetical protein
MAKVIKYREYWEEKRRRSIFETYKPKKRFTVPKENTLPIAVRIFHKFLFLGGIMGFVLSGVFMGVKSFFGFKQKVNRRFGKVVEFKAKK